MANGDQAVGPSGVPRISIYPPGSYNAFEPIQEETAPAQSITGYESFTPISPKEAEMPEAARPQRTAPEAPSLFNTIYQNMMLGAQQRTNPSIAQYGQPISSDVYQSDAGETLFKDEKGNIVPTDASKHVVLVGPDNKPTVYARSEETAESPAVGAARVLTFGLGAGAPQGARAPQATISNLENAARAVYQDPAILGRAVNRNDIIQAFRDVAPQLQTFHPDVQAEITSALRMPGNTVGDLRNASETLGEIADRMQQTAGGLRPTRAAAAATIVKQRLDRLVDQVAPEIAEANSNYSAAKAAETIGGRAGRAEVQARGHDFAARMRTQAGLLLQNPRWLRGFTPREIELLHRINDGTLRGDALRRIASAISGKVGAIIGGFAGSHAGPLGTAVGAGAGITGEATLSAILTKIGNRLAANQVNALSQAIRARSPLGQLVQRSVDGWELAMAKGSGPMIAAAARGLAQTLNAAGTTVSPAQFMPNNQTQNK